MGSLRRFRNGLTGGLLVLLAVMVLAGEKVDAAVARIVGITVEPGTTDILLEVSGGVFDPVLWVEEGDKGTFRIVIEGEGVRFDDALQENIPALSRTLADTIREVRSVNLMQHKDGQNAIRIVLEVSKRLRPQVRANTGSRVSIALVGASRGQPAVVKKPEPLSVVTLEDPTKNPAKTLASDAGFPGVTKVASPLRTPAPDFSIYALEAGQSSGFSAEILQAWDAYRGGRLDSARMTLETWLGSQPHDPVGRYLLGLVHLASGETQRATLALQKVTEEHLRFLPAWLELIRLNLSEGNFPETDELLRQAMREFPENPELLYARGLLQEARGEADEALKTYISVLSGNPDHLLAHYRLAIVELKRNRPASAAVELRRLILANPDDLAAFKALGYAYHREGDDIRAAEAYLRALKPDVLINYAGLLSEDNRQQEALTLYRAAELLAGGDANIQFNLGMIYADLNEPRRAVASLNRFIELARDDKDAASRERVRKAKAKIKALETRTPESAVPQNPRPQSTDRPPGPVDYRFAVSSGR